MTTLRSAAAYAAASTFAFGLAIGTGLTVLAYQLPHRPETTPATGIEFRPALPPGCWQVCTGGESWPAGTIWNDDGTVRICQ